MLYMLGGTSYGIRNAQFTINFNDGSHYQINQAMSDWVSARCALSSTKRKLSHLICLRDTSISAHVCCSGFSRAARCLCRIMLTVRT